MKKLTITEEEKKEILSKHNDIDKELLTRLMKISNVELRNVFDNTHINIVTFDGYPDYSFNTFLSKKDAISRIVSLVVENDFSDDYTYELFSNENTLDEDRQRLIRTIKRFLRFQLPNY